MVKVYATVPGAEIWIPPYGTATNDRPCLVPPTVAEELSHAEGLRVEPDELPPVPKKKFPAPEAAPKKE
jgi:hypothetical protein